MRRTFPLLLLLPFIAGACRQSFCHDSPICAYYDALSPCAKVDFLDSVLTQKISYYAFYPERLDKAKRDSTGAVIDFPLWIPMRVGMHIQFDMYDRTGFLMNYWSWDMHEQVEKIRPYLVRENMKVLRGRIGCGTDSLSQHEEDGDD